MKRIAAAATVLAALVLAGCGRAASPNAGSDATNPPAETGQTTFICSDMTSASLLQWNDLKGSLSGSYTESELGGSPPSEKVTSNDATLTGTRDGSAITINLSAFLVSRPLSGSVNGTTLMLNVPQSDGSLEAATCQAGTLDQWNRLIALLSSQAASANTAYAQQQARASVAAADAKAQQAAQDALAAVQKFSLAKDLAQLASDVKQTAAHLADEKKAAAIGPNEPGETDCYNLTGNVNYAAANSVEYDARNVFSYDGENQLLPDITHGRQAIGTLRDDIAALQARGLPVPAGVDAAVTAAEKAITDAITTADGYIDQVNGYVDKAYAVANATATGDCADQAIGAAPAHIPQISI